MLVEKAKKVTLYDDVMTQIQTLIQNGTWSPGDKLPPERELTLKLGVSRNTLRECLKALTLVGVLEARQGGGNYVSNDLSIQLLSSSLKFVSTRKMQEIIDLLEARRILEATTASLAAQNATPELIKELQENNDLLVKNVANPEVSMLYDIRFHMLIATASGNQFLAKLIAGLQDSLRSVMLNTNTLVKLRPYTVNLHQQILTAIANHDAKTAERVMKKHLLKIEDEVRKSGIYY